MDVTISGLAKAGGVGVETVRYYQRRGLLSTPLQGRGYRHYGEEDLRRLQFIRSAQTAGFTLTEIAELIELDATSDRPRAREIARARITTLDEKIAELTAARAALAHLADACSASDHGPCPIIDAFAHQNASSVARP